MTRKRVILAGFVIGFTIAAFFLPGGFDAAHYFLRSWFPETTVPAWSYIVTIFFAGGPWPLAWATWMAFSTIAITLVLERIGNEWYIFLAPPILWSLWLGQVEVLLIIGAVLAHDVARGRSAWFGGPALLLLLIKPQVGALVVLWMLWYIWKHERVYGWLKVAVPSAIIVYMTTLLWPGWFVSWMDTMQTFPGVFVAENVSLYGLLSMALFMPRLNHKQQLTVALAIMMVFAPYACMYHYAVLLVIAGSPLLFAASWLIMFIYLATGALQFAIVIPVLAIADALRNEGGLSQWRSQQAI